MASSEDRKPALRKPKAAAELERLSLVERILLRVFEALSSVKLAVFLMAWLIIECAVGTFVEAQVNTAAAWFFVYKSMRFKLLMALLATNILCAALIRFPWKRYQTGFLITHIGLLTVLFGSMLTSLNSVDKLMPVEQGKTEARAFDPEAECLFVTTADTKLGMPGKRMQVQIPVQFGPFTWGHKIFGSIPWRKDHTQEHDLDNGDKLRVKMFYANCEAETQYKKADSGPPAIKYRLRNPERGFDNSNWLVGDPSSGSGGEELGMGNLLIWRVGSDAELDHFVNGAPKKEAAGLLGTLSYTNNGKHRFISVAELKSKPIKLDDEKATLRLIAYYPNARLDKTSNDWITEGDEPKNPLVRVGVRVGDAAEKEYLTFGRHRDFDAMLIRRQGADRLFTYFPADPDAVIEIAVTADGKAGYRAFGSQGLIAANRIEPNVEYAGWAGMKFSAIEVFGSARKDAILRGKALQRGTPGRSGIVVEYESGGKTARFPLMRDSEEPSTGVVGDRMVALRYGIQESELPFSIRLDEFEEPKNPGTQQAAMYTSKVTLVDKQRNSERAQVITMNYPLYHTDVDGNSFTLYQSGIDRSRGKAVSTYTVARDPGLKVKYVGSILLVFGAFLMFYMGGYFKRTTGSSAVASSAKSRIPPPLGVKTLLDHPPGTNGHAKSKGKLTSTGH